MNPYLGEIRTFGFNYAPVGWAFCSGQTLAIGQNAALFSILGTTYGGDGRSNFQLPNLNANAPLHAGTGQGLSSYTQGGTAGVTDVTLTLATIPSHTHGVTAQNGDPNSALPTGNFLAKGGKVEGHTITAYNTYAAVNTAPPGPPTLALNNASIVPVGGNLSHNNQQPYLTLNFCIALQGVFPQRP